MSLKAVTPCKREVTSIYRNPPLTKLSSPFTVRIYTILYLLSYSDPTKNLTFTTHLEQSSTFKNDQIHSCNIRIATEIQVCLYESVEGLARVGVALKGALHNASELQKKGERRNIKYHFSAKESRENLPRPCCFWRGPRPLCWAGRQGLARRRGRSNRRWPRWCPAQASSPRAGCSDTHSPPNWCLGGRFSFCRLLLEAREDIMRE